MGFSIRRHSDYEAVYDFSYLTTVAWNTDPALVCTAHQHGARVVLNAGIADLAAFTEPTVRAAWTQRLLQQALDHCLDGINFDFEGPIAVGIIFSARAINPHAALDISFQVNGFLLRGDEHM